MQNIVSNIAHQLTSLSFLFGLAPYPQFVITAGSTSAQQLLRSCQRNISLFSFLPEAVRLFGPALFIGRTAVPRVFLSSRQLVLFAPLLLHNAKLLKLNHTTDHTTMADLGKLTWRKRKRLISQGRCFRCHQKGHHSNECKHSWGSRLAQLPVELLHEICLYLVYPNGKPPWDIPWTFEMKALRLTCREIDMKTYDFFTKIAFKSVAVYQSYEGLQTLSDISESRCASRIKQLVFFQHDRVPLNYPSLLY